MVHNLRNRRLNVVHLIIIEMLTKTLSLYSKSFALRQFAQASRYVGPNDGIREERKEARKFGMKRHFYDKEFMDPTSLPTEQ